MRDRAKLLRSFNRIEKTIASFDYDLILRQQTELWIARGLDSLEAARCAEKEAAQLKRQTERALKQVAILRRKVAALSRPKKK